MLQLKDLRRLTVGEEVTGRDGKISEEELEGPRGGGAWFAGHPPSPRLPRTGGRIVPN